MELLLSPEAIFMYVIVIGTIVFMSFYMQKDKKQCTEEVEAVVEDFVEDVYERFDESNRYAKLPIYRYEYKGQVYKVKGNPAVAWIKVGDRVKLYINPDNPTQIHAENEKHQGLKILLIMIIMMVLLIVLCFGISSFM